MARRIGPRWLCAVAAAVVSAHASAEDFCADFWSQMPSERRDGFMAAADARAAEKAPPAQREALRSCLAKRRPALRESLDRACASGQSDPDPIVGILQASVTPCLESVGLHPDPARR